MIKNFIITFFLIGFIYNIPIATDKSLNNESIIENDSISYVIDSLKSELINKISDIVEKNSLYRYLYNQSERATSRRALTCC